MSEESELPTSDEVSSELSTEQARPMPARYTRVLKVLLDEVITIPGTNFKIGLDPILGLIPGWGDAVTTVLGSSILFEAARRGVPIPIILKMISNTLLNAVAGALPGIGDAFSAWFKSNARNYDLIALHSTPDASGGLIRTLVVVAGLLLTLAIALAIGIVAWWLIAPPLLVWLGSQVG